jgi:Sulfotransferase domain
MQMLREDLASRKLRLEFCKEFLRDRDAVKAAIRAGVSECEAPAFAARLIRQASTGQLLEVMSLAVRYARDDRYQNPPTPITDNIYYCCSQKTGSQWLKRVFIDHAFYQATGLKVLPYVALGMKYAHIDQAVPRHTVLTHLYASYDTYASIPKPRRFKTFYVVRDPRDAVVSWYYSARFSHNLIDPIPWLRERLDAVDFEDGMTFLIDTLAEWQFFDCQRSWFAGGRADPSVRIFRYEDLARDEAAFLRDLLGYLDVRMSNQVFTDLCERHAFAKYSKGRNKAVEDQNSHYRRGSSGDWREKFTDKIHKHFHATTGDLTAVLGYQQ